MILYPKLAVSRQMKFKLLQKLILQQKMKRLENYSQHYHQIKNRISNYVKTNNIIFFWVCANLSNLFRDKKFKYPILAIRQWCESVFCTTQQNTDVDIQVIFNAGS